MLCISSIKPNSQLRRCLPIRADVILFLAIQLLATVGRAQQTAARGQATAASPRPNIVVLLADDMGYGDVAAYNPESKIPTPNMDQCARSGMRFTDAHTPSSVCTPTRYGLLTGRYCWRSRLKSGVLLGFDHPLIEPGRETLASLLARQGYACGCVGKWHLGLGWALKNGRREPWPDRSRDEPHAGGWEIDYAARLTGGPTALGFDYFFGIAASNNMAPYCFIEQDRVVGNPNVVKDPLHYGNSKAPMVAGWDDSQYGPNFTDQAVAWLERQHREHPQQPFFLYLPSQAPHRPCVPPDFVQGKSQAGRRGDMVVEFDWTVGRILQTLEKLGLREETIVFISSDNGATPGDTFPPESGKRNGNIHGKTYGHLSCGDLRGYKSQIWEGGHRVPLLVRWPEKVPAATTSDEVVCLTDLMATVADVLEVELPQGAGPDSVSMLPALQNAKLDRPLRESLVVHDYSGRFALRQGRYKYVAPVPGAAQPRGDNGPLLFDLTADPGETQDLSQAQPNVVRRMAAALAAIQKEQAATAQHTDAAIQQDQAAIRRPGSPAAGSIVGRSQ